MADWLAAREAKAEKKAKKAEEPPAELDPEQARKLAERQAKSALERKAKVDAGLADLDRWLGDLARRGLAAARGEGYDFWERPAARMVDAQAPGVARLLRELAGVPASGEGWQDRLLERLARLHLLVEGYRRLEALPPEAAADLRAAVGWTVPQEEVLAGDGGPRPLVGPRPEGRGGGPAPGPAAMAPGRVDRPVRAGPALRPRLAAARRQPGARHGPRRRTRLLPGRRPAPGPGQAAARPGLADGRDAGPRHGRPRRPRPTPRPCRGTPGSSGSRSPSGRSCRPAGATPGRSATRTAPGSR